MLCSARPHPWRLAGPEQLSRETDLDVIGGLDQSGAIHRGEDAGRIVRSHLIDESVQLVDGSSGLSVFDVGDDRVQFRPQGLGVLGIQVAGANQVVQFLDQILRLLLGTQHADRHHIGVGLRPTGAGIAQVVRGNAQGGRADVVQVRCEDQAVQGGIDVRQAAAEGHGGVARAVPLAGAIGVREREARAVGLTQGQRAVGHRQSDLHHVAASIGVVDREGVAVDRGENEGDLLTGGLRRGRRVHRRIVRVGNRLPTRDAVVCRVVG
jgi:hypothetical protein